MDLHETFMYFMLKNLVQKTRNEESVAQSTQRKTFFIDASVISVSSVVLLAIGQIVNRESPNGKQSIS